MNVPQIFKPVINTTYPSQNHIEFERWFWEYYQAVKTDRHWLPINWTAYYVNSNYGNDKIALQALQVFLDDLPRDKKYFTICQYDDGILNNIDGLDILQFHMSKNIGVPLPLICQHGERKQEQIKYMASFVGSITHPIRQKMINALADKEGYYISTKPHSYDEYSRIMAQSMFTLCPRGYGSASFRTTEAIYQGSIPIYISDEFIIPFNIDFDKFGVVVKDKDIDKLDKIILDIDPYEIIEKQNRLQDTYDKYYSYEGCMNQIIKHLEKEFKERCN